MKQNKIKEFNDKLKFLKGLDKNILIGIVIGVSSYDEEALDRFKAYLNQCIKHPKQK